MPLQIYTSNRMEQLVASLAGTVARPLPSPFDKEVVVVQSKGMQRWLSMELARRFGVWANGDFPFPNAFVWRLFGQVVPGLPETSTFDPGVLTWRIMGLLPEMLGRPGFEPLRAYLGGGGKELKLYQLAEKIADTLDQYTLFRPEMLAEWETGKGEGWQADLWRALTAGSAILHRARVREEFARRVRSGSFDKAVFPERIALFGVSYLPAFHLEVFALLARHVEVNLFLLSPCAEYWGDIVSARERARLPFADDLPEVGNPLLSSLGRLGRDFSDTVLSLDAELAVENDRYQAPGGGTVLSSIQSDILLLRNPGETVMELSPADCSLQIHSCHGPMREIEILHDQLLRYFETDPALAPRDILVMTPDIETYAPFITAVFDGVENPAKRIPFSIADRSIRRDGHIAEALLAIMDLPGGRFGVTAVLDILESPPVRRKFGLDDDGLGRIRGWLTETGIRWGIDEEDRSRRGLPPYRENSWRAGLDRLLLGYAMPDEGRLFAGILPFDAIEGDAAQILGKFAEFVERLATASRDLARPRTLEKWEETARLLLDQFVETDEESARELMAVSKILDTLGECRSVAGFDGEVALEVFSFWLAEKLEQEDKGLGFLTGSVTFCAMLPMRSIPFKVIALIGMNDGAFPRQNRPPGFDLMAKHPRRGDRSLRDEDRYLFLEALLSARDSLYISYVGQGIRDNAEIPPSVLVSELLDYVESRFAVRRGEPVCSPMAGTTHESGQTGGSSPTELIVTRHRLQPFSLAYFNGTLKLVSYSGENCAALREKLDHPRTVSPFLTLRLTPDEELGDISLETLLRFYDNPVKFLLVNRLGIRLDEIAAPLEEREPFAVDGLAGYGLKQELLNLCLEGGDLEGHLPLVKARGILPPAHHGAALFADLCNEVAGFAGKVREQAGVLAFLPHLDFELDTGGFQLTGRLDRLTAERLVRFRCAKMKGKDQVRLWIEHLVLNAIGREGYPRESILIMTDKVIGFAPVENAREQLETVLDWFRRGLSEPLRFFPESSLAYGAKLEWNPDKARRTWEGSEYSRGEGEDQYLKLCFRGDDPFAGDFDRIAREIVGGMMDCVL